MAAPTQKPSSGKNRSTTPTVLMIVAFFLTFATGAGFGFVATSVDNTGVNAVFSKNMEEKLRVFAKAAERSRELGAVNETLKKTKEQLAACRAQTKN